MLDVIGKIIDIDKNAKGEVAAAKKKADQILEEAAKHKTEMKRGYDDRIKNRIEIVTLTYNKMADEEIAAINKKTADRITALNKVVNDNKERWGKDIYAAIIGI